MEKHVGDLIVYRCAGLSRNARFPARVNFRVLLLCLKEKQCIITIPLSAQDYKWLPTSVQSNGSRSFHNDFILQKPLKAKVVGSVLSV